jgi:hypothetical protein
MLVILNVIFASKVDYGVILPLIVLYYTLCLTDSKCGVFLEASRDDHGLAILGQPGVHALPAVLEPVRE